MSSLSGINDSQFTDVHSITGEINLKLGDLLKIYNNNNSTLENFDTINTNIMDKYKELGYSNENLKLIDTVLTKMFERCRDGGGKYVDPHLNINIFFLLSDTWAVISKNEEFDSFYETLLEMGTLCTQGDSHRLLMLLVGYL